jgi:hypothetical protein
VRGKCKNTTSFLSGDYLADIVWLRATLSGEEKGSDFMASGSDEEISRKGCLRTICISI